MKWKPILAVPLIIALIGTWLLWPHGNPEAAWYDENYSSRQKISYTHDAEITTDRAVTFSLDTAELITAGLMQSDCDDVRFTDINGKVLKYQLTGTCNNAATTFEMVVPSVANGTNSPYVYYGNPSANSASQSVSTIAALTPSGGDPAITDRAAEEKSPGAAVSLGFNEGYGTTTNDSTENNNDGTITNAVWKPESECINGPCLYLDGTGDYVSVADANTLDIANTITISAWVKPNLINGVRQDIVTKASSFEFRIHTDNTFRVKFFGLADDFLSGTMPTPVVGEWIHLAATYDGSNIKAYVNGKLVLTDDSSGTITTNSSVMLIGSETTTTFPFKGFIDEVRVYPFAKTADQIKTEYNARGSTKGVSAQFGAGGAGSGEKLSNGLVGYWKMDESVADTCTDGANDSCDSSGNGNDGSWISDPAPSTAKYGNGLDFDGEISVSADYVLINDNAIISITGSITLSSWVYIDTATTNSFIDKYQTVGNRRSYRLGTNGTAAVFVLSPDGTSATETTVTGSTTLATGTWYHVVGAYDGKTMRLYINGVQDGSAAYSSGIFDSVSSLRLGDYISSSSSLDGKLDDVRIYNRALEPREVAALYNWAPGPVGYWNLEEVSGSRSDSSGNGNTLTDTNTVGSTIGKYGKAADFENKPIDNNESLSITDGSQTGLDITGNVTIESWVKVESTEGDTQGIAGKDGGSGDFGYGLKWHSTDKARFSVSNDGTNQTHITGGTTLSTNTWYHIAGVYDGSNVYLYVNGISDATPVAHSTGIFNNAARFCVGFRGTSCAADEFDGVIDDLRVYNYARTSGQITEDMNGGHPIGGSPVGSQAGYWQFEEGYSTTVNDTTDNDNDLTMSTASWTNSGKYGKAWDGNAVKYVSRADDADFDFIAAEDFTISSWIKTDGTSPGASEYILNKSSATAAGYGIYGTSTGKIVFAIDDDATWTPDDSAQSTTNVYDTNWHHIAARKTGTSRIDLFIDGKLEGSDTTLGASGSLTNAIALYIGDRDGTDNGDEFNGDIDEVKVYRGALTDEQIKVDYNQGQSTVMGSTSTASDGITADNSSSREYCVPGDTSTCSAPIGEWKFNEHTGTSAFDTSTNGNTQTLTAGPTWKAGKLGSGINFDGTDDYLTGSALTFGTNKSVTMWAYVRDTSTTQMLFTNGASSTDRTDIGVDNGSIRGRFYDGTTSFPASGTISSTGWYHIGFTFDGTTPKIYLNGLLQTGTANKSSSFANTLEIGRRNNSSEYFNGIIDEVRAYNYIRTPAQVALEYNRGAPVAYYAFDDCQGTTAYNTTETGSETAAGMNGTISFGSVGNNTAIGTCGSGTASEMWADGTSGKINASIGLDGGDDYVEIADTSPLRFDAATADFSLFAWVKRIATGTEYIFSKLDANNDGWKILFNADVVSCGVNGTDVNSTSTITDTNWHHVGCTIDRDGNGQVYIDGKPNGSTTSMGVAGSMATTSIIRIGSRSYTPTGFFGGQIDDARIYNYVLTPIQVKNVFNGGSAVRFAPITGSP